MRALLSLFIYFVRRASMRATSQWVHPWGKIKVQSGGDGGIVTSHILLTLENDEGISPVGLLFLVRLLMGPSICYYADLRMGQ